MVDAARNPTQSRMSLLAPCSGECGKIAQVPFGQADAVLKELFKNGWVLSAVSANGIKGAATTCFECAEKIHGSEVFAEIKRRLGKGA